MTKIKRTSGQADKRTSSKSSKEAYGAAGKRDVLLFDPEQLVIVADENHPLYDDRHKLPVSEALVLNILHHLSVLKPVSVRKNPETGDVEVADGRQRVKACREANKRLKAKGCETIQIMAIPRRGDEAALAEIMVSSNEHDQAPTPLNRAKKAARLIEMGRDEEQIGMLFGVSKATVKNYLALLECTSAVQRAVESEKLPVSYAYKLAKLEPAEQRAALEEAVEGSEKETTKRGKTKRIREATGTGPTMRGKKEIKGYLEKLEASDDSVSRDAALAVVRWVLGGAEPPVLTYSHSSRVATKPSRSGDGKTDRRKDGKPDLAEAAS